MHRAISLALLASGLAAAQPHTTWRDYGGAADSAQYSALRQIDRTNVNRLEVAWTFSTGDENKYAFNPLAIDGTLFVLAKNNSIVALDATSGKEIWTWVNPQPAQLITNRGLNYWESKDRSDRRLFFAADHVLHALDARTGTLIGIVRYRRIGESQGRPRSSSRVHQAGAVYHARPRL